MEDMVAPPYGKQVLIGNWMDRRYASDEKGKGILPKLNRSEECEHHRSLSQDTYTDEPYKGEATRKYFKEQRITRFCNFKAGTTSNVKLIDAPDLMNNYTTTNTLVFDWLPKLRKKIIARSSLLSQGRPEPQVNLDMLQCYGNLTKAHNFSKRCKYQKILSDFCRMQTTYASSYDRFKNTKAGVIN